MKPRRITRRSCLEGLASVAVIASARPAWSADASGPIPQRVLGKTKQKVSMLCLGGYHSRLIKDDLEAVRFIRTAIDMGVTFLDNAWEYHKGGSEELYGKALRDGYRDKVFLMTKTTGRSKQAALKQLDDSLRRMKVDVIDLWQAHQVVEKDEPARILAKGGAIEAFDQARKAGKVRFIGFTGHRHPELLMQMLESGYPWDTVQMPINVLDPHFRSFSKTVLPAAVKKGLGIIAMKSLAFGGIVKRKVVTPREALVYALSQPVSTLCSGMDKLEYLKHNAQVAAEFKPFTAKEQATLLARTAKAGRDGKIETFKARKWE